MILILDFGSQYTRLIARKIRELQVRCEIYPYSVDLEILKKLQPNGIIFSGGPNSVFAENAPKVNLEIFSIGVPILGICYGYQLMMQMLSGSVEKGDVSEYGPAEIYAKENASELWKGIPLHSQVWMSHTDKITAIPNDFQVDALSKHSPYGAVSDPKKKLYGLQFHPEVAHTDQGVMIISNFIFNVCSSPQDWNMQSFVNFKIDKLRQHIGNKKVLCALSGGVDSSVAALLLHRAIGEQLTCMFVDNGLLRKNEAESVMETFSKRFNLNIIHVNAQETFLSLLKNVDDPEKKRKIIGSTFIDVFEKEARKFGRFDYLAQGTLYSDVIESVSLNGPSVTIKSHHNVGGLPEKMNFTLLEPLRELFKDEVRKVGLELGISKELILRHPFPGPGLAVRILGEVTTSKVSLLQEADSIFIEEMKTSGEYEHSWQAFAVLLPVKSVGVMGDNRTYENVLAIRSVTSTDAMTADWSRLPYELLAKVSNRIINEVQGINRVVYDITSKPPGTIEWE